MSEEDNIQLQLNLDTSNFTNAYKEAIGKVESELSKLSPKIDSAAKDVFKPLENSAKQAVQSVAKELSNIEKTKPTVEIDVKLPRITEMSSETWRDILARLGNTSFAQTENYIPALKAVEKLSSGSGVNFTEFEAKALRAAQTFAANLETSGKRSVDRVADELVRRVESANPQVNIRVPTDTAGNVNAISEGLKRISTGSRDSVNDFTNNFQQGTQRVGNSFQQMYQRIEHDGTVHHQHHKGKLALMVALYNNAIREIVNLFQQGFYQIVEFLKSSVNEAVQIGTTERFFQGFFHSAELGTAVLRDLQKESSELGVNLVEIAQSMLPFSESLDQISKIGAIGVGFTTLRPDKSTFDFVFALKELLAGQVKSFQTRFNIPANELNKIKDLQKELGLMEGTLVGLENILANFGITTAASLDTPIIKIEQFKLEIQRLKGILGEPILDTLLSELEILKKFLEENNADVEEIVQSIGELIAVSIDLLQAIINLNTEEFTLGGAVEQLHNIITLIETLTDALNFIDNLPVLGKLTSQTNTMSLGLSQVNDLFRDAAKGAADLVLKSSEFADDKGFESVAYFIKEISIGLRDAGDFTATWGRLFPYIQGSLAGIANAIQQINAALSFGFETKFSEILPEDLVFSFEEVFDAYNTGVEGALQRQNQLKEGINELTDEQRDAANQIVKDSQIIEENLEGIEEAQKKVNEAFRDFRLDLEDQRFDMLLKHQRELEKAERGFADDREKELRKNQDNLDKIERDYLRNLEKAATDLGRNLYDIRRKNARKEIDLEKERVRKRIELEQDLQRELDRIRRKFEFDQQEAIRQRDAIAFLRLERAKQFQLEEARIRSEEKVGDQEQDYQEKREKIRLVLEQEIEDANLANQRKLEDLQVSLSKQLEEEKFRHDQSMRELKKAEEIKRRETEISNKQELEDFDRKWQRKLRDLNFRLAEELALLKEHNRKVLLEQTNAITNEIKLLNRLKAARATINTPLVRLTNDATGLPPGVSSGSGEEIPPVLKPDDKGKNKGGRPGRNSISQYVPGMQQLSTYQTSMFGAAPAIVNNYDITNNVENLSEFLSPQQIKTISSVYEDLQLKSLEKMRYS